MIQELAAKKRAGLVWLVWVAVWVVGAAVLHLVLASPFTGETLLVYALPLLIMVGVAVNAIAKQSVVRRCRRKLGTGVWRWIAPERLRFRGRTVVFDLDDGKQAQVRLSTNGSADITRHHGLWMITDRLGNVEVRTAGSTMRRPVFTGEKELPGGPSEPDGTRAHDVLAELQASIGNYRAAARAPRPSPQFALGQPGGILTTRVGQWRRLPDGRA
nr:hypothetical protein [Kibdelosporangium sp. MJ126-NF4]